MCGGSTSQTTQQVQIPADVLARYNSVNTRAEGVANTPFQVYSQDPNAFVAPLNQTQQAGVANTNTAAGQAQPYYDAATGQLINAQQTGASYLPLASQNIDLGQAYGSAGASQALHSLQNGSQAAAPLQSSAAGNINGGLAAAQPYNTGAGALYGQGLAAAQPFNTAANQNISGAQAGAQPYQDIATGLGLAGARSVDPSQLSSQSINQYLSPYLDTVLGSTQKLLTQQNQQEQAGQLGNAIKSGYYGGDRAGIAAANLKQQQQLANGKIYSDILNQGYTQALGTAQQQQGLGLSAEQANRAAQQAASGQLAAIGQQGFGQGITTAQQQAALGNQVYSQGLGAGQAIQGLGNQVYGQQTGTGQAQAQLGQQLYGQGLSSAQLQNTVGNQLFQNYLQSAQQQAGLGQQAYSMGSNTSQQLAGLGAGAQGAALQGAQAQLAAGQQQQQTSQAGLTALYNQFLQQQSYPFQVSQFLANIAEGTGALSGSTTTTTQPGGFFSDDRLKEGVKQIGETYDGLKIVRYKYKDDPNWRVGFIAQDVEKKHPDAVGERQGYKTVDYGKASEGAAKRGHFADGGVAGFDPEMAQQLLANSRGMYGPYLTAAGGNPYPGGLGRVPNANLPVGELKTAGAAPKMDSPLQHAKEVADLAQDAQKGFEEAKKAWTWAKGKYGDDEGHARGGRTGLAGGGTPYAPQTGPLTLDIPDEKPDTPKLQTPGAPPKQESDFSKAIDIAKVAAIFAGMADGGAVNGESNRDTLEGGSGDDQVKHYGPFYASPPAKVTSSSPAWPFGAIEVNSRGERMWNPAGKSATGTRHAESPREPFQMAYRPTDRSSLPQVDASRLQIDLTKPGRPWLSELASNVAAPARGLAAMAGGLSDMANLGQSDDHPAANDSRAVALRGSRPHQGLAAAGPRRLTSAAPAAPAGGLAAAALPAELDRIDAAPRPQSDVAGLITAPQPALSQPSRASRVGDWVKDGPIGGYFSGLKHGDPATWTSLLAAIGSAGTAPTVHPGVALAAGLSGGARAYLGAKGVEADIAKTKAGAELTHAQTFQQMQEKAPSGQVAVPGKGPRGESFTGFDGKPWHYELQVNATDFGAPGTASASAVAPKATPGTVAPSPDTDARMVSEFKIDPSQTPVANRTRAFTVNPALAPLDEAANHSVQARIGNLQDAETSRRQSVQLAEAYANLPKEGLMAQGHASDRRAFWANVLTTAQNIAGIKTDPTVTDALSENQIIAKIKELSGPAIASQYGEKAASVSHAISGVIPSGDTSPKAASELIAALLVQAQMAPELAQYKDAYAGRYGVLVGVEPAFQRDMGATYSADQRALAKFMGNSHFTEALADLQSPDQAKRQSAADYVDKVFGSKIHRYFVGGQ